jgi:opacity protein-like surface antigen
MKKQLVVAFSVLWMASWAHAEYKAGSQSVAVVGGLGWAGGEYQYQPGSDDPVSAGGGAIGGQYLYYFRGSPALGVGFDLTKSFNGTRSQDDVLTNFDTDARVKSLVGMAILRLSYPHGFFRPFVFGGMGFHDSSQTFTATPRGATTWPNAPATGTRTLIDESKTSFAMGGGVGFDIFPRENFFIGTELRAVWLAGLDTDENEAIRNAGFSMRDKTDISQMNILMRAGVTF